MIAQRIRELRKENNLSQSQLGKELGTDQKQISKWETGTIEPNIKMLIKLALTFQTTIDYLVGKDEF